jgi:hypothetical protein
VHADVVIGVESDVLPERHVVRNAVVRQKVSAFFIFEDDLWQTAGGAVHAQPGHIAALTLGLLAAIGEIDEPATLPPVFA